MAILPVPSPAAAEIVALPAASPRTNPLVLTVATDGFDDVHVNVALTTLPDCVLATAVSCASRPVATTLLMSEVTSIVATFGPTESPQPARTKVASVAA